MRATRFEFERRFWIICAIYIAAFSLSFLDPTSFITGLRHWIAPSIQPSTPQAVTFTRIVMLVGGLLVFLAVTLRTWAAAYLRTDVVHDTAQHSEALVADGPFRNVRNPLYLANVPLAAGIGVLASRLGFLFLVAANWIFVYRLIFREEEALRKTQGESYRSYLAAVPRFWPSLTPRVPSGHGSPSWGQALGGESFIWLFGIAEICLAITLDVRIATIVFVLGFVAYFIGVHLVRRPVKR
jgi:protein-S-isoprenylcysteine O-methyltransferase Ste14